MERKVVIFTRFSDPHKQWEESLEAQELKCRQVLDREGINCSHAIVLREKGERGTHTLSS